MQTVLNMVGELVAHEWRFLLLIPIFAIVAYAWTSFFTTRRIMEWTVRLFPLSARLHLDFGWYLASTEPEKAEPELRRAIALDPERREAYYVLANMLLSQKERLEDAEQAVRQAARNFPDDPTGFCFQGMLYERQERYTEAERAYRKANADAPLSAWPCVLLGQLLRDHLDNPLGAELAYQQAVRNEPRNWSNYFHLGNLCMESGRYEEAVTCFEMARRRNLGHAPVLINLGLALAAARRVDEAKKLLPRAMRAQPKSAFAELRLGRLLRQLKQPAKAEAAFRRAIEKGPGLLDSYVDLSRLLDQTSAGMCAAEDVLRQGLKVEPKDQQLNYDLSLLLRRMGREQEAIPCLEEILSAQPDDFDAFLGLAGIYKACGDCERYLEYTEKARRFAPSDEPYALACLEAISDNPEAAFEHLRLAAEPDNFSHWWAWQDPDLQFIRADPRFAEIVGPCPEKD